MAFTIRSRMSGSHLLARMSGMLATARRRSREREALAMLEDRDLRELGLTRAALAFEMNQPFWRG